MHRCRTTTAAALAAGALLLVPAGASADHFGKRTLRYGMQGSDVRVLQDYLTRAGFRTVVDGQFGRRTRANVRRWERAETIRVDGKVTRRNARRLLRADSSQAERAPEPVKAPIEKATLAADGTAIAPESAPQAVKDMIAAGNRIHDKPYKYGGGHGERMRDSGYDCSGSMSYVLRKTGFLERALDSTGFMSFGRRGKGRWVTLYANEGHSYMIIAGLRFDTSGRRDDNSRWDTRRRSSRGYAVRHIRGL